MINNKDESSKKYHIVDMQCKYSTFYENGIFP